MSKKIQLYVPEPCHENWDKMTPVQKGKFCGSCQKVVVDFTRMSDREVAQFFKKPSTGSVCGRFMQDQLDRDIEIPRKRIPWVKYFFQFALPAFLVSIKASAQTARKLPETVTFSDTFNLKSPRLAMALSNKVAGLTVYNSGSESSNARITLGQPRVKQVVEETLSACRLTITRRPKELGLQIQKDTIPPAPAKTCTVKPDSALTTMDPMTRGEVVVVGYYSRKSIQKVSRRTKRQEKIAPIQSILPVIENKNVQLKAFPNPVSKGGSVTVETISGKENSLLLRIVALDGRLISSQSLHTVKGVNRFPIVTGNQWPGGVYYVQLLDENSKIIATEQIIIQ